MIRLLTDHSDASFQDRIDRLLTIKALGMEIGTFEAEPIWTEFLRKGGAAA